MKRIITFVALFVMIFVFASAESRLDYAGAWSTVTLNTNGGATIEFFYLAPSGQVFYMNERFTADGPSFGRQYLGFWTITGSGIHIVYGETAETDAFIAGGFLMIEGPGGYIPLGRAPEYSENTQETPDVSSMISTLKYTVILPAGEYIVGRNLPAGTYSVRGISENDHISFIVWGPGGDGLIYSYSIGNTETLAEAVLEEGYQVNIWRGTAILTIGE